MTQVSLPNTGCSSSGWVLQTPSPSCVLSSAKRRYTDEQLQLAIDAVCKEGLSTKQAAALHGVPSSTLWHRLHPNRSSPSSSSSSSFSSTERKSPYPLRHTSCSTTKSPYYFRHQPSAKQSPEPSSRQKHPLAKHSKSATPLQVIQQRSAGDAG